MTRSRSGTDANDDGGFGGGARVEHYSRWPGASARRALTPTYASGVVQRANRLHRWFCPRDRSCNLAIRTGRFHRPCCVSTPGYERAEFDRRSTAMATSASCERPYWRATLPRTTTRPDTSLCYARATSTKKLSRKDNLTGLQGLSRGRSSISRSGRYSGRPSRCRVNLTPGREPVLV